jgi:hypothetical protein
MSNVEFRKIIPENRPPKKPVMVNLTSECDEQLSTIGLCDLKLTIGSKSIIHPVYITENKTPAILGIDTIKAFGLLYSHSKNCFTFETNKSLPIHAISQNSPNNSAELDYSLPLAPLTLIKNIYVPLLTSLSLSVSTLSAMGYCLPLGVLGLTHVSTKGPALSQWGTRPRHY